MVTDCFGARTWSLDGFETLFIQLLLPFLGVALTLAGPVVLVLLRRRGIRRSELSLR